MPVLVSVRDPACCSLGPAARACTLPAVQQQPGSSGAPPSVPPSAHSVQVDELAADIGRAVEYLDNHYVFTK